jgi:DNA modification methylase
MHCGDVVDVLKGLPKQCVNTVVTSPPYWGLRDYGVEGQIGLEQTPEEYVEKLVAVFREVGRVLRDDGTVWLNLGDSYAGSWGDSGHRPERTGIPGHQREKNTKFFKRDGHPQTNKPVTVAPPGLKPKDLVGIPWRVAFALQADGWYLRSDIIWAKPNPMPESVTDRPIKSHEYVFLLSKNQKYFYDGDAIREKQKDFHLTSSECGKLSENNKFSKVEGNRSIKFGTKWSPKQRQYNPAGRNRRTVWTIPTTPYPEAHFAVFPEALVVPCIKAGCPEDGVVLDPFMGAGTALLVALKLRRRAIGIDLKEEYCKMALKRIEPEIEQQILL